MSSKTATPSFLHCPPLSRDEKQRFKEQGVAAAHELVRGFSKDQISSLAQAENAQLTGGPIKWELDSNEHDLKIYVGKVAGTKYSSFNATPFMSTIRIVGTMTEVFDLFRSQTTEEAKEYCRRFGNVLEDAVNLYSIFPATPETPHEMVGISWRVIRPPVDKLITRRDSCLLDVHHAFEFNGKQVWVRCLKSVVLACCPEMPDYLRMTHQCTGHVFSESDKPGHIDVSYIIHADAGGNVSDYAQWMVDMAWRKGCRNLTKINRFLRENRLSKTPFLKPEETKPTNLATTCHLCLHRFGPFSKKTNCLKCGQVFCRRCIQLWDVKNRGFDAQAHVCARCALGKPSNDKANERWHNSSRSLTERSRPSSGGSQSSTSPRSLDSFDLALETSVWRGIKE
ncbi:unnamed protein product [Aphanomyces euteiches]